MNAEIFAEWLRRQRYRVVRTPSSYWYEISPRVYQAFPYHWVIQPTKEELSNFLRQNRAIALRYSTPVDSPFGYISYHAVYGEPSYTLDGLDRRSRQNVRLGLKNCHVELISFERLAKDGWSLEKDTLDRQGRHVKLREETWHQRCMAAADLPGFEAWGALVDGRLAASLLTFQMEDCCEMISQQCHRDYLRARVNNALSFVVTQTMVTRTGIRSVFYALHSLDAPASVDEFKFRMGYVAKPVRQRVAFHPWLAPVFNRASHAVVKRLLRWYPDHPTLAKAEGMLRFYLEGKRPLGGQNWPECLTQYVAFYTPRQRQVLAARPGMTSPASLHYREEETLLSGDNWEAVYREQVLPSKLALDLAYLQQRTLWTDLALILQTIALLINAKKPTNLILSLRNRHFFMLDILALLFTPILALTLHLDRLDWWPRTGQALIFFTLVALLVKLPIFYKLNLYNRYWGVMLA